MLAKIHSGTLVGLEGELVIVEADIAANGLPAFNIVGLADRAVEEARERVRSAIRNSGGDFPAKRITINLAPADLPKEGPLFDLAIAVGILIGSGQLKTDLSDAVLVGELSLDGSLRSTQGVLAMALMAKKRGLKRLMVPEANSKEAGLVRGIDVYGFTNIQEVVGYLSGQIEKIAVTPTEIDINSQSTYEYDFSHIRGQEQAKRALEIAAAGGHNVLMSGMPGSGKTLLARTFPSILPALTWDEALEVTQLYSSLGLLPSDQSLMLHRPIRSPHHSASHVGIIGGGVNARPGDVSLAHRGVLFLDELPEFPRQVLEALRQPLEDRQVTISRAAGRLTYPAQFILLAAQNPCPCGYFGSVTQNCSCSASQIMKYQKKISGPLLDRIDIHLQVAAVDTSSLINAQSAEDSFTVRQRVILARQKQQQRFSGSKVKLNVEMTNQMVKQYCQLDQAATDLLAGAIERLNLSARAYFRILKVARTIADLSDQEDINSDHLAEALQYRGREH